MGAATNFDTTRVRFGQMVSAVAGFILIISPFLEWYNISAKSAFINASVGVSGWDALSFVPWVLTLVGLAAIAIAVMRALGTAPANLPASQGFIVLVLGAIAVLLTLFRLLVTPDAGPGGSLVDIGRSFGVFLAFLAAIGVTVGGWLTWNEEGKPMPGGAGAGVGGPGAGAPLGQGPPPYAAQPQSPVAQPQQQQGYAAAPAAAAPVQAPTPPAEPAAAAAKADWYPDPRGEKRLRYWDGSQWTDHTAD